MVVSSLIYIDIFFKIRCYSTMQKYRYRCTGAGVQLEVEQCPQFVSYLVVTGEEACPRMVSLGMNPLPENVAAMQGCRAFLSSKTGPPPAAIISSFVTNSGQQVG